MMNDLMFLLDLSWLYDLFFLIIVTWLSAPGMTV